MINTRWPERPLDDSVEMKRGEGRRITNTSSGSTVCSCRLVTASAGLLLGDAACSRRIRLRTRRAAVLVGSSNLQRVVGNGDAGNLRIVSVDMIRWGNLANSRRIGE